MARHSMHVEKPVVFGMLVVLLSINIVFTRSFNDGDSCVLKDGTSGSCKLLRACPSQDKHVRAHHMYQPVICRYQGRQPVVCCREDMVQSQSYGNARGRSAPYWNVIPTKYPSRPRWWTKPQEKQPCPQQRLPMTTQLQQTPSIEPIGAKSKSACKRYSARIRSLGGGDPHIVTHLFEGVSTKKGEYPHMALLGYNVMGQPNITWNCGGTLISHRYVVTVAHCFTNSQLRIPVRVRLGEHDLEDDDGDAKDYFIESFEIHPGYRTQSWYDDIALIKLKSYVKFSKFVRPACLWTQPTDPENGLEITGWGSTVSEDDGSQSTRLLKGNRTLSLVSKERCDQFYKAASSKLSNGIQDGMLCAQDTVGFVSTCKGDSGGPIQIPTGQAGRQGIKYFIVGITSTGWSLCGSKTPTIFSRIYHYLEWIEGIVWKDNLD